MRTSVSDLFLAYRQAKSSLFFEKRGVGLVELAKYEENLAGNLIRLRERLEAGDGWFADVDLGQVWVVPKRRRVQTSEKAEVVFIGGANAHGGQSGLDISLRLSPSPDFAIVEILYLWQFGPNLDAVVPKEAIGYRLELRDGQISRNARWVFEYWPKRYNEFRRTGLRAAQKALDEAAGPVDILSADLASFYDTIDASFLLSSEFREEISAFSSAENPFNYDEYRVATKSLLGAHSSFHSKVRYYTGLDWRIGIPIGALTSRLIANVALASLDRAILRHPDVLCYRRYVDDLVIVGQTSRRDLNTIDEMMTHYVPPSEASNDQFELDVDSIDRPGSAFSLQREKCRAHRLEGQGGRDFLSAIEADFRHLVSERRAFLDASVFNPREARRIIRAGKDTGSTVRSLRDADRTKLEHFALSTALTSLERLSMLVEQHEARQLVKSALEGLERLVADHDSWVESIDSAFRLLGIAVGIEDWDEVQELLERMDVLWGDLSSLQGSVSGLFYRETRVENNRAQVRLRDYLHEARIEAICGSIGPIKETAKLPANIRNGLNYRTRTLRSNGLLRRARALAAADLRAADREDDIRLRGSFSSFDSAFREGLDFDESLVRRLDTISSFVEKCRRLSDPVWDIDPGRLFLCTRPPTYFDIARRWLYNVENKGFREGVFEKLLAVVNAVRGTNYVHPVGSVISEDPSFVLVPIVDEEDVVQKIRDPRLILGNLVVTEKAFLDSLRNTPLHSVARLRGLATVLAKATEVAQEALLERKSLLVLPELSLPRKWFRAVSNYVAKQNSYGLVAGLEYLHDTKGPYVLNQAYAVLPGPYHSVATWPWTKRRPADVEAKSLAKFGLSFRPVAARQTKRAVIRSPWGQLSVLICSELLEVRRVADLLRRVELLVIPSWNKDTASYDHLIQTTGMQLHAIMAIANNGSYSDCRAWAPKSERWARDLCRLVERGIDDVVYVDIPLESLREFHANPLPTSSGEECSNDQVPEWRPLPPDWSLELQEEDT